VQLPVILRILGILLVVFSTSLLPPIAVSLIYSDGAFVAFFSALVITLLSGALLWGATRNHITEPRTKDGFLIVVLFWTVLGFVGALPFVLGTNPHLSIPDAVFESFSGLTTTGATVLTGIDDLPKAILFYRQQLQWMGGMGIIVLAVAILPMLGIGGMQLYKAETPGPMKDSKLAPRISETAKALWYIYMTLTIACAGAYWLAGMDWFDAITHSFSTIAIGGFSTHDASIGYFDDVWIEIVAMVFMLIAGVNFALHFTAWRMMDMRTPMMYFNDPEFKMYITILGTVMVVAKLFLYTNSIYDEPLEALRYAAFQTISIGTTTGFATTNFSEWPGFLPTLLIFVSFIGACAGSTGGGMKVIRFLLLYKQGLREITRLLHPQAIIPVKLGKKATPEPVLTAVWGFFALYVATFTMTLLALMLTGLDQTTAFSAVAACMNNLGPGLGEVASHYGDISDTAKWILVFAMLLGRLEIFTLLVLFTRAFWRA